ncbi:hypothetical protein I4I73_16090 [Pseudonocardia sp. KRD-184]|uniref:GPR1/FUN34/yaaH family protein n=1 Tax=Pseudonocardia oceani TaxID=2792013 RepID=A0ABS6UGD8_9PSEU|nr:hypothetical protein [Pseudonocardia oceani]MBW0090311.1 hypothetical protein [Pseudonocardia oceani]MBW0097503.1 hypothetical protein [Pseudonocardia oceani]MBW0111811.1 hypothetical protein [Pseudonocardia oceani]MBW0123506.1 hypothetical protein [Pseudonocardia oceani]MBW0131286.1 hypothetical protein [Pseudonocardia oceani]
MSGDGDGELPVRVVLRPVGTPLPLGFLALAVATTAFAAVQLGWVPVDQSRIAALAALLFTVPLQLVACVFGFLARDPVAGTGMGVLAGTWATVGVSTLTAPPGTSSPGLGVVLLVAAACLLVPAAGARGKLVAAAVMVVSAVRFAVTGVAETTGSGAWLATAGWVGIALALLALYAAVGFEIEDVRRRTVLPLARTGAGAVAVGGAPQEEVSAVAHEAGVRKQL